MTTTPDHVTTTPDQMITTWLAVTPLDTIMVRDGRPFDAGTASSAQSVAPPPNTLGGVVRAAVGRDVRHIVGPVVATARLGVLFPTPQDLVRDGTTDRRLAVEKRAPRAVSDLDPLDAADALDTRRRLSHHLVGEGDPVSNSMITRSGLADWLTGALVPGRDIPRSPLLENPAWVPEPRLGLARQWTGPLAGTAAPGLLYAMTQLRPREETRFLVGCVDDQPVRVRADLVPFGGRRRLAEVTVASPDLTPGLIPDVAPDVARDVFPSAPQDFPDGRLAVYLATPALLTGPMWCPPEAELAAVAVRGPQPVASASPLGAGFAGSRLLAWAVPAGSVFYLTFGSADAARRWAASHHGGLLPGQSGQRIVTAGFGTCLTGRW